MRQLGSSLKKFRSQSKIVCGAKAIMSIWELLDAYFPLSIEIAKSGRQLKHCDSGANT